MPVTRAVIIIAVGCLIGVQFGRPAQLGATSPFVSADTRIAAIRRARVWAPVDVRSKDLMAGPAGPGAFAPNAAVSCDYVNRKTAGNTPKFMCLIAPGDEAKVKFGQGNGEVFGEVAASRLVWALGFGAEREYPVRVVCRGCPRNVTGTDFAAIQRSLTGADIESFSGSGWAWPELSLTSNGSAHTGQRAEREALTLLAALIQHTDSKPEQQRLVCVSPLANGTDLASCPDVFMFVHDLGMTFGSANYWNRDSVGSVNFAQWRQAAVWKNPAQCIANLSKSYTGTLENPMISEAGRRFLADLLVQLTDQQLHDLFAVARMPSRLVDDNRPPEGATIAGWVDAFKDKRNAVVIARCPS